MKIEEMVLSIEQMQYLKELGLEVKDTALCWVDNGGTGEFRVMPNIGRECFEMLRHIKELKKNTIIISTLTLQEILELLPEEIVYSYNFRTYHLDISKHNMLYIDAWNLILNGEEEDSLLNCAYRMLCWVLESNYL